MLQHNFDPIIYMVEPEQAKEYIKAMLDGVMGFIIFMVNGKI